MRCTDPTRALLRDADVTRFVRTVYALGSIGRAALGSAAVCSGLLMFAGKGEVKGNRFTVYGGPAG